MRSLQGWNEHKRIVLGGRDTLAHMYKQPRDAGGGTFAMKTFKRISMSGFKWTVQQQLHVYM